MMLVNSVFHCILIHQLRIYGGYLAITVWGIIYRLLMVFFTPIIGLYQGAQPIIGYNYGAAASTGSNGPWKSPSWRPPP